MGKKKRKPNPGPRCKRMKRAQRLQSAQSWLPTYEGKDIVKGYRKHYGVDWQCAFTEQIRCLQFGFSFWLLLLFLLFRQDRPRENYVWMTHKRRY